jgi:5-methylthioribose kinase
MTDLGESTDYLHLYEQGETFEQDQLNATINYLIQLHKISPKEFPDNMDMRLLNHEHIFKYPFREDNGFDLNMVQEGLAPLALKYIKNKWLVDRITRLGNHYLKRGDVLCHGDFYPGCWLNTADGLKVIDPEFSFPGFAEFDMGMMIGHLTMAQQPNEYIDQVLNFYQQTAPLNRQLVLQIGGVAILRRILGVAQLPLTLTLQEKETLMDKAVLWILS